MPLTYFDTSGLVKRYVPEVGSSWVTRLCQEEPVVISLITIPEMASAVARRTREGVFTPHQRDTLYQEFLRDVQSFAVVALSQAIARQAAVLLLTAPAPVRLRSLDALHVASAQWSFARASRLGVAHGSFVTADRALAEAAQWAGLIVMNPEDYR